MDAPQTAHTDADAEAVLAALVPPIRRNVIRALAFDVGFRTFTYCLIECLRGRSSI
jgi:hypothetical protein